MDLENKIAIIGSGALGTSLAKVLHDSNHKNVVIYGVEASELKDLKKGLNRKYFPKSILLPHFMTTTSLSEAIKDAKYIILAIPSIMSKKVITEIKNTLTHPTLIINGSKGFYPTTNLSLHEGLKNVCKNNNFIRGVVSLIGPSHAEEIVAKMPTMVAIVTKKSKLGKEVQKLLNNQYFKSYIQFDVIGASVGSIYKNVLAIFIGMIDGLNYGINTKAALLTRGMKEMQTFNKAMKGKKDTIYGLTGLGDLIVTGTSELSRNFSFGKEFIKNDSKFFVTKKVVEGVVALKHIYQIGKTKKLYLPIAYALYDVLFQNKSVKNILKKMWTDNSFYE